MKKRNLLALMLLGASLMFVGCGGKPSDDPTKDENNTNQPGTDDNSGSKDDAEVTTWTVTFDTDGGSEIAAQTVKDGEKATRPEDDPTKDTFVFLGWYADEEKATEFDFDTAIKANTTIYASWESADNVKTFTVKFDSDGGPTISDKIVVEGKPVANPSTEMTKRGYKFAGWFNGETLYDFKAPVSADITLKAKWNVSRPLSIHKIYNDGEGDDVLKSVTTAWDGDGKATARLAKKDLSYITAGAYIGFTVKDAEAYQIDNSSWTSYEAVLLDPTTKAVVENTKNSDGKFNINGSFIFEITESMLGLISTGDNPWEGCIEFHGVGTFSDAYYIPAPGATYPSIDIIDLTTAENGYGSVITYNDGIMNVTNEDSATSGYTQIQIPFVNEGATKALITLKNNGSVTIGFQEFGAKSYEARLDVDKYFDANADYTTVEVDIPETAVFITIGSNNVVNYSFSVKKIEIK